MTVKLSCLPMLYPENKIHFLASKAPTRHLHGIIISCSKTQRLRKCIYNFFLLNGRIYSSFNHPLSRMLRPTSFATSSVRMPAPLHVPRTHRGPRALRVLHPHHGAPSTPTRMQPGPAAATGGLLQMGPTTTYVTNLLLQHLDETLATYV
jgi:hypothetical protein